MDALRRALGVAQIDLLGASYGSLLGLTVLKNHPEGIRAAVLDSVVPLAVRVSRPEALDRSLRTLVKLTERAALRTLILKRATGLP